MTAEQQYQEHLRRVRQQERVDAEVAQRVSKEMNSAEREHQRYEATRDELFAKRIQNLELQNALKSREPLLHQRSSSSSNSSPANTVLRRPEPQNTPPLPVMADGDVPQHQQQQQQQSFLDLRGGIRYNDRDYKVKVARPAFVTSEPLYANNQPEHYAVSSPYPVEEELGGACGGVAGGGVNGSSELLGAAGLSQKDLALSKRAEEILEQEKRDKEIAMRLQDQLSLEIEEDPRRPDDEKAALEAQDLELARQLHAKEKAKLKRAKERAKLKKLEQQQQQQQLQEGQQQLDSSPNSLQDESLRTSSRLSSRSKHSNHSAEYTVPARKPYMNRDAIDNHEQNMEEPQYENVPAMQAALAAATRQRTPEVCLDEQQHPMPQQQQQQLQQPHQRLSSILDDESMPVPPYMPMQQSSSKKSSSLEKRINKKKEKEGCKQQ